MRHLTNLLQINGQPLYAPDNDMQWSYTDLDSSDSGRDESGIMHREVVRRRVGTANFVYARLTDAEYAYLTGILDNAGATFSFTHPARGSSSALVTSTCYCSNDSICWYNAREGLWHNFKFNIIEC